MAEFDMSIFREELGGAAENAERLVSAMRSLDGVLVRLGVIPSEEDAARLKAAGETVMMYRQQQAQEAQQARRPMLVSLKGGRNRRPK